MRVLENPGRHVMVEQADGTRVTAERVSHTQVALELYDGSVTAATDLSDEAGRALLRGLAALYGCELVETGL